MWNCRDHGGWGVLILGVDVSTFFVDYVLIPHEGNHAPVWHRFPLTGADAWERARSVAQAVPGPDSAIYEDVLAVGVENPAGRAGTGIYAVQRVVGAVLVQLPAAKLVHPWRPSEWRKAVGLKGNATKDAVFEFVVEDIATHSGLPTPFEVAEWSQDACDAYCVALATRDAIRTDIP